ncbi:MAG: type I phosphomannose isomerase catalytic subunit [candidate division FCPU426 bacterium]
MKLGPLTFIPKYSPKPWGGRRLERLGKTLPPGESIGESWEIYDRPEASSVVAEGPWRGSTLEQMMKEWGPRLLGPREFDKHYERFPLMVKFIDAREALSVQVHPDDDQALRLVSPHELGKTEMWSVLEADPDSSVVAGLKRGTDREIFLAALKAGKLDGVLNQVPVKPGDVVFIPAGRVHAIGAGCLIAEIQQNSDTTFRVYDYGRLEKDGKPRDLHLGPALECIRFDDEMAELPGIQPLADLECPYFRVERLAPMGRQVLASHEPCFQILLGIGGEIGLHCDGQALRLKAGSTVLIPADLTPVLENATPGAALLRVRPF